MARVIKAGEGLALELPEKVRRELGLGGGEELALYELRPGLYVIGRKGEELAREVAERKEGELGEGEIGVVRKLESVKFSDRTPRRVAELLSAAERRVLDALLQNKAITLFKSAKYRDGVYNIPRRIYELAKGKEGSGSAEEAGGGPKRAAAAGDPEDALARIGYAIVERERDVKRISDNLQKQVKSGELMGVRGFDKRFYLARKGFYVALSERVERAMRGKKARSVEEIARDAKINEEECAVVLNLMREEGEVLEKKRGTYELA